MQKSSDMIKKMLTHKHIYAIFVIFFSHLILLIYSHPSCGLYGSAPCQFVPAPPGHTPSCARPGKTYCEHVDNYPIYLIKHLVKKWGIEARSLIIDETYDEFNTLTIKHHDVTHFFELFGSTANHLGGDSTINGHGVDGANDFNGYKYDYPTTTYNPINNGYPEQPIYIPKPRERDTDYVIYTQLATNYGHQRPHNNGGGSGYHYGPKVSHYNPVDWLKRYARDLSAKKQVKPIEAIESSNRIPLNVTRVSKDVSDKLNIRELLHYDERTHRKKRQSPGRSQLCQTNSQYIMPQAALNSKGDWMYVVNVQNTARQLVKTETCASNVCSNLCQLPIGYNSRCEQKYVQKRLVALNSNGQNLYTDTFWFPSCCVCTISNN